MRFRTLAILTLAAGATGMLPAQPPPPQKQERDLKYEGGAAEVKPTAPPPRPSSIPRSYALVVGIATYKNLASQRSTAVLRARRRIHVFDSHQPGRRQLPRRERPQAGGSQGHAGQPPPRARGVAAVGGARRRPRAGLLRRPWFRLQRTGVPGALRSGPGQYRGDGIPHGDARLGDRRAHQGEMESAADRRLPQRSDHARGRPRRGEPRAAGSEQLDVLAHRQPRPRAFLRERRLGRRPRHLHLLRGQRAWRAPPTSRATAL